MIAAEQPNQGKGKIARYPRAQRDEICRLIRDGALYAGIIKRCEQMRAEGICQAGTNDPVEIPTEVNITNFKNGPLYRDWLKHNERMERDRAKREFTEEYLRENGGSAAVEGRMLELQSDLYNVLDGLDLEVVNGHLAAKPGDMPAFLNALARLGGQTLGFDKYRDHVRARKEAIERELKQGSTTGGITPETLERIERELKLL